ncbi:GIN domain-containing protein [Flavobacterium tegetincola]|uniref:GIN domain-containing protein n=1 Tax=Flavobacterium tegetincola TaxID=150172 RepID=UPI0004291921|nr:DUF2807 domain-containing protein [Flavobacterium tegetincola]
MKIKNIFLGKTVIAFLFVLSLTSCNYSVDFSGEDGNGNVITQNRVITEKFEKIEVNTGLEVIVEQKETTSVTVKIDENIQSLITTEVINGVLIIRSNGQFDTKSTPLIRVSLPIISGLKSTSGSTLSSGTVLKSTSLSVDSSSGSEVNIEVEADYISMESSSGSEMKVQGKALKAETSSSSGSAIDAENLMANEVYAQVSSGSSTTVYPILLLKGKASSGGDITYTNVPKRIEKEESSGGSVGPE